ncbi:MAG: chromosomal replication initiator protein DnaA [Puniceicoccales bacterium]|jgi:chromosomal replication initiator protein|nr:chromosomal replication initiator protein DnaA [Puniceicoccales bacterium]
MSRLDDAQTLWRTVQIELQRTVARDDYQNWFEKILCTGADESSLVLEAPTDFAELWINKNYRPLLERCISLAAGRRMSYSLVPPPTTTRPAAPPPSATTDIAAARRAARAKEAAPPPPAIKSNNTFANFITGPENELAHSAALAVASDPGHSYNPLFIYGATGLGKTHLLHAIAHAVMHDTPQKRIIYVTSEAFTNGYINGVQEKSLVEFRRRYREADVLLIDDVQFLAGRERTQDEFFHTFNDLHNYHKQIVLTSDRPPREMNGLQERLVSRFVWGLTADISAPRLETRIAILRNKIVAGNLDIADNIAADIIRYIATRITSNIRNLEGAVMRLKGMSATDSTKDNPEPLTIERIAKELAGLFDEEAKDKITPDVIQRIVADYYRIPETDMTSKRRTAQVAFARQVAMSLCTKLTSMALTAIGEAFGGRDHGTVIHAKKRVEDLCETNSATKREVEFLSGKLVNQRF